MRGKRRKKKEKKEKKGRKKKIRGKYIAKKIELGNERKNGGKRCKKQYNYLKRQLLMIPQRYHQVSANSTFTLDY